MRVLITFTVNLSVVLFMNSLGGSATTGLAPFHGQTDLGPVKHAGSVLFDNASQEFTVVGAGANMWDRRDECHFVWTRLRGDFLLRAEVELVGDGVEPHRKMGLMFRDSLAPDARYVDALIHGDGSASLQFRQIKGGVTEQRYGPISGARVLQLGRQGGKFTMRVAWAGEPFASDTSVELELPDELYAGLFVCSHNADVVEQGKFRNVRLIVPARHDFAPYRDYIGGNLEILDVTSGRREIVYSSERPIQAPNWTTDGKALIYNREGLLYRFDLETRQPSPIYSGSATTNNNDHALSLDGKQLGISHHDPNENGRSLVYVMPVAGGEPKKVTSRGPSYFHGWSPDGRELLYTGDRNGKLDIYKISAEGGEEAQLTDAAGLDDGAEYTPDGKWIYFNSSRSGRMQIWRMTPGGYDQQQTTDDGFNNWFPHVSPDGKQIVMLSYSAEIDAEEHPFYREVYLRLLPIDGGPPKVIAYVYGGQGTINVPSWAPDGKRLAFVSNSDSITGAPAEE